MTRAAKPEAARNGIRDTGRLDSNANANHSRRFCEYGQAPSSVARYAGCHRGNDCGQHSGCCSHHRESRRSGSYPDGSHRHRRRRIWSHCHGSRRFDGQHRGQRRIWSHRHRRRPIWSHCHGSRRFGGQHRGRRRIWSHRRRRRPIWSHCHGNRRLGSHHCGQRRIWSRRRRSRHRARLHFGSRRASNRPHQRRPRFWPYEPRRHAMRRCHVSGYDHR
jgi:hypothetical protein